MITVSQVEKRLFRVEGACVDISYVVLGMLSNNTYIISDGKTTVAVDPSCKVEKILDALGETKLDGIILTHYHYDHVGAAQELRDATKAEVFASEIDADIIENPDGRSGRRVSPCPVDHRLVDNETIKIGSLEMKTILAPGHTHGCMCFYLTSGNHADGMPVLISGDVLFNGAIGRTDFEDGDMSEMRASLAKLVQLPDETLVLPGHNDLTTIAAERQRTLKSNL